MANFRNEMIVRRVPKAVMESTREYMDSYNMSLADAFTEAVRENVHKPTELFWAWYYSDFRKFIPSAYVEEYLDFKKFPLRYKLAR